MSTLIEVQVEQRRSVVFYVYADDEETARTIAMEDGESLRDDEWFDIDTDIDVQVDPSFVVRNSWVWSDAHVSGHFVELATADINAVELAQVMAGVS